MFFRNVQCEPGVVSRTDCQHTGKRAACSIHQPLPWYGIYHPSRLDKRRTIVSISFERWKGTALFNEKMPLNITCVTWSRCTTSAHTGHNSSSLSFSAWAVMMDRRQQRLQLALLPPALFIPTHQDEASRQKSLEALGDAIQPFIIYQETSDIWINVRPDTTNFSCSPTLCLAKEMSWCLNVLL